MHKVKKFKINVTQKLPKLLEHNLSCHNKESIKRCRRTVIMLCVQKIQLINPTNYFWKKIKIWLKLRSHLQVCCQTQNLRWFVVRIWLTYGLQYK